MIRSIAIFGDSWSKVSKEKSDKKASVDRLEIIGNRTFENLFKNIGIAVDNYSIPGGSNRKISDLMVAHQTTLQNSDLVIVFQTDPLRDVLNQGSKNFELFPGLTLKSQAKTLDQFSETLCKEFYSTLSRLDLPILLVGGLSELCIDSIPSGLDFLEQSWSELVDPTFDDCYYEWVDPTLYVHNQLKFSASSFFEIEKKILMKNNLWQQSDKFGWCHPGDQAYDIMFEVLKNKIKE